MTLAFDAVGCSVSLLTSNAVRGIIQLQTPRGITEIFELSLKSGLRTPVSSRPVHGHDVVRYFPLLVR